MSLKFLTLVASQKSLDKQCRPRSDCFFKIRVSLFAILTSILLLPDVITNILFVKRNFKTFPVNIFQNFIHCRYSDERGLLLNGNVALFCIAAFRHPTTDERRKLEPSPKVRRRREEEEAYRKKRLVRIIECPMTCENLASEFLTK